MIDFSEFGMGHSLNGFELRADATQSPTGFGKFILENCIANSNSGYGFHLDHSLQQAEVINCKGTNNLLDGFKVEGKDVVLRLCVSDLNMGKGFDIQQYYPFIAKAATNTSLLNLPIYGGPGTYNIEYVAGSVFGDDAYAQFINIIPNVGGSPLPAFLSINSTVIGAGDTILVKDETGANATLNGVYQALNDGGVVVDGILTPIWQLIRVDQWRAPLTVPAGTKVFIAESHVPNKKSGPVMYILENNTTVDVNSPRFKASKKLKPDCSKIILDSCKGGRNGGDCIHNSAKGIVVRSSVCDLNQGTGFFDDSTGGAEANGNLYILNEAYNNGCGTTKGNYNIDYVVRKNKTVLRTGTVHPPVFPKTTGQANISITPCSDKQG